MAEFKKFRAGAKRSISVASTGDSSLGPLKLLPGTWANIRPEHRDGSNFKGRGTLAGRGESPFDGRGWNVIALPFAEAGQSRNYRLLMNQYNEVLRFTKVDDNVPNRGISQGDPAQNTDQLVAALDYEQSIAQIAAEDVRPSGEAGAAELPIHHEPGLFLHMKEQRIERFDIARLATIPHGNSATALGRSREFSGPPSVPDLSAFPEGIAADISDAVARATNPNGYLFPYNHFTNSPFMGVIQAPGFPGFSPANANGLLQLGLPQRVRQTTELHMDTDVMEGGIANIPFIERQADAVKMHSTFWIMELEASEEDPSPSPLLAYSQTVMLDFFDRVDGRPGLIRWPHVSINVMEKIEDEPNEAMVYDTVSAQEEID